MNQARRRTVIARGDVYVGGEGPLAGGERHLAWWASAAAWVRWWMPRLLAVAAVALFAVADQLPGTASPFALSTRRAGSLGRRKAHQGPVAGPDAWASGGGVVAAPPIAAAVASGHVGDGGGRSVEVPWERWEEARDFNTTARFAGSMVDRHLFGSQRLEVGGGSGPAPLAFAADRDAVARVMIFKLPRSGSTWFTEVRYFTEVRHFTEVRCACARNGCVLVQVTWPVRRLLVACTML